MKRLALTVVAIYAAIKAEGARLRRFGERQAR